jgi:pyruvate carboxylase
VKLAKELEKAGTHILAIKDMAGLIRPEAARILVTELKNAISLPIHLHTHDTSGNQVAALLEASKAGVDVVDAALSSMSGMTSQPSMNAVVTALQGTGRDTGVDPMALQKLADYWAWGFASSMRRFGRRLRAGPRRNAGAGLRPAAAARR